MPFTTINPIVAPASFGITGTVFTFTALDNTNGNQFQCTGREVVLIQNADGVTPHTITFTAQPDREGRSNNLTQACAASGFYITQLFPQFGWAVGGYITLPSGQSAQLQIAVLQFTL